MIRFRTRLARLTPLALLLPVLLPVLLPLSVDARQWRTAQIPNGGNSCLFCHTSALGGSRNLFGSEVEKFVAFGSQTAFWNAALAALDSDGDGITNGEELGDPEGDGTATPGAKVTFPGDANSNPTANKMPTVSFIAPANNASFEAGSPVVLTANAADSDGSISRVEFFVGNRKLGESTTAPFSVSISLYQGNHSVIAKATDNRQGTARSSSILVRITAAKSMQISGITPTARQQMLINFTGGVGPFVPQSRPSLEAPGWINGPAFATREQALSAVDQAGFIRINDVGGTNAIPLSVSLHGELEVPEPVTSTGSGFGLFRLEGNHLIFTVSATGLSGAPVAAHIHGPADVSQTAPPMFDLNDYAVGSLASSAAASGTILLNAEQKLAVLNGKTYVNFHTQAHPGGEIRGQIVPVMMESLLLGVHERPDSVSTSGSGTAGLLLVGNQLSFNLSHRDLTGPAQKAHLHGPADATDSAPVLVDLESYRVGSPGTSGGYAGTIILTPAQLATVASGRTYLNIHTPIHGSGEIRGQVLSHITATPLSVVLDGASVRPIPVPSNGSGLSILRLEGDELRFDVSYRDLSGTALSAQLHGSARASAKTNSILDLTPYNGGAWGTEGTLAGMVRLNTNQVIAARTGLLYLDLQTAQSPEGEIRGQLVPSLMQSILDPAREVPALPFPGVGNGVGVLIVSHKTLSLGVGYRSLLKSATLAHIHGPATTSQSAQPIVNLELLNGPGFGSSGTLVGTVNTTPALIAALVDGLTYLNVHTLAYPGGEIRGQILR